MAQYIDILYIHNTIREYTYGIRKQYTQYYNTYTNTLYQ